MSKGEQILRTKRPEETESVAVAIGQRLRGGEVIELASDLGGGKTTFTKGLVAGLGSSDHVASPTFTISKEYSGGRLRVHHFDFYRLHEAGIVAEDLAEVLSDENSVVVIEWADIVAGVLPDERLRIIFEAEGESMRKLTLRYPESLAYLAEDI